MPRAIWSGAISFGLVNVPVKVITAVRSKDVRFNMLHGKDGGRIEFKRVCSVDGEEVPYEEISKGYKVGPDEFVVIEPEDLEALEPEKTNTIDIVDFVDLKEIDPIYYEKPYYLIPGKGGAKAYALLADAMKKSHKVGIARVVMREKEHLVVLRVKEDVLTMETMLYADEVVEPSSLEDVPREMKTGKREVEMAEKLIDALTTEFDPQKYKDEFRERVMELIETKAEGKTVIPAPRREEKAPADLADALKASLEAAKRGRSKAGA